MDEVGLDKHCLTLTDCQRPFVDMLKNWIKKPRNMLAIVSGGPGTGKTYVVKSALNYIQTTQLRMSFTARSAIAIGGKTIHSALGLHAQNPVYKRLEKELQEETDLRKSIVKSQEIVSQFKCDIYPNVIVIDEVSMINGWFMYWLILFFMKRTEMPLLFICIGDPHQLNPVKSIHNIFSIVFAQIKFDVFKIYLKECKRFVPEYELLINTLRSFVNKNSETGMFTFVCENFNVVEDIDRNLLMQADRAMAFRNETVRKYNSFYLKNKIQGPEILIENDLVLKSGCLVYVTRNGCSQACNGTQLIFQNYDFKNKTAICKYPKTNLEVKVEVDSIFGKMPLVLGFAATIHKYQGDTIDDEKILINFDGNRNLNMVYTALSRVRSMNQILAIEL